MIRCLSASLALSLTCSSSFSPTATGLLAVPQVLQMQSRCLACALVFTFAGMSLNAILPRIKALGLLGFIQVTHVMSLL